MHSDRTDRPHRPHRPDHPDRTANLLGAAALAVTDLVLAAARARGVGPSAAAALVVLSAAPGITVTELGRRVGLSQSAAVRMVDGLAAAGLAERGGGPGRSVAVRLTAGGRTSAADLLAAREAVLSDALADLSEEDREALTGPLSRLLASLYGRIGDTELICRLCDRGRCTTGAPCPVGAAARAAGDR
ncbi:MarR family transcriptional regulator [Spirillospora sp. NPDC029432]|uniref:MarR family winged helix-turn-helix transcriptional regulator n=1 Tax=Spirillospora sp. NPDC029432 TaxID=3154599 RepID=UPI0034570FE1